MIYNYPYFSYPNYNNNYRYPSSSYYRKPMGPIKKVENQNIDPPKKIPPKEETKKEDDEKTEPFFSIFGIDLYFDDILLVCLLFFLYKEGVKDQYLFISLILLLLS